jgi:hypothetical protein
MTPKKKPDTEDKYYNIPSPDGPREVKFRGRKRKGEEAMGRWCLIGTKFQFAR